MNRNNIFEEEIIAECNVDNRYIFHFMNEDCASKILIMENNGYGFACVYWYHDENCDQIYLDSLSVDEKHRNIGIGRQLQEIGEKIGLIFGAKYSYLLVGRNTWMHEWYKRRGYVDFKVHNNRKDYVWMRKCLI